MTCKTTDYKMRKKYYFQHAFKYRKVTFICCYKTLDNVVFSVIYNIYCIKNQLYINCNLYMLCQVRALQGSKTQE